MKKGRKVSFLILLLALTIGVKANTVDMDAARDVAMKFVNANTKIPLQDAKELQLVTTYNISCGDAAFYVFNTPHGFVIVAADDCITPLLGYSDESQFDVENIPVQLQAYLQDFVEQIQFGIENHIEADAAIKQQWEWVRTTGHLMEGRAITAVAPLLSDKWGQGCYYNTYCPVDSNGPCGHVKVGCVATSFAQVLHYWGYPSVGMGSHTYKPSNYPTQTAHFGATAYDWAHMPDSLSNSSTSTEINAVATLMWHCGVAVDMNYGPNVSGALFTNVVPSLLNYFGYSDDLSEVFRNSHTNAEWLSMMKSNLNLGRPVLYSGTGNNGGHAFVCDGYDSNNLFHFNWGWYGNHNGYFPLSALNVGGNTYNSANEAIINIHPKCASGTSYHVTASRKPSNGGWVYGTGYYGCCDQCSLTAIPAEGYVFSSWAENGMIVSTEPTYSFTVVDDRDLVANFALEHDPHVISAIADPEEGGTVYGSGIYDSGTVVTLTAVPNEGYGFTYWEENGVAVSSDAEYSFMVSTDRSFVAHFALLPIISVTANLPEGGTVTGGGAYDFYATCTLTATANEGYVFYSWTKNGTVVSYLSTYVFSVTESADYVANFEQVDGIVIGDATYTNRYIPSYCCYYSLSEQIYTATEMGGVPAEITSVSFFNTNYFQTCNMSIYMVHTDKAAFESTTDWVTVTEADQVFCGSVAMTPQGWSTIHFSTPFLYDGVSNVALIVDDNTCIGFSAISCRTFGTETNQAIRVFGFGSNPNPTAPYGYTGTLISEKNQVIFGATTSAVAHTTAFVQGWNWISTYIDLNVVDGLAMLEESLGDNGMTIATSNDVAECLGDGFWVGLEGYQWTNSEMIMVEVNEDCTVTLVGPTVDLSTVSITIRPGWNWMGFPFDSEIAIVEALADFEPEFGDGIVSYEGLTEYIGVWTGDFETLVPGHGYLYYSAGSTPKTLVFSTGTKKCP